jgi:type I restriction enzyme R subunit
MKQAIEEGFILDVLKHYTPVNSYYKLSRPGRGRPGVRHQEGAKKKLRRYVESHDHAIRSRPRSWSTTSTSR